jgi:hypothetical protein
MNTFSTSWLPNIVCLIAGFILGWSVTHLYARRASQDSERQLDMLRKILLKLEKQGEMKLERNEKGEISGGTVLRIDTRELTMGSEPPSIKLTEGRPTARTEVKFTRTGDENKPK